MPEAKHVPARITGTLRNEIRGTHAPRGPPLANSCPSKYVPSATHTAKSVTCRRCRPSPHSPGGQPAPRCGPDQAKKVKNEGAGEGESHQTQRAHAESGGWTPARAAAQPGSPQVAPSPAPDRYSAALRPAWVAHASRRVGGQANSGARLRNTANRSKTNGARLRGRWEGYPQRRPRAVCAMVCPFRIPAGLRRSALCYEHPPALGGERGHRIQGRGRAPKSPDPRNLLLPQQLDMLF